MTKDKITIENSGNKTIKREFNNYDDIPQSFDNVIKFEPTSPEPPHTEEEHEEMETYNDKLKELLKREKR